jgi:hypothetical protein
LKFGYERSKKKHIQDVHSKDLSQQSDKDWLL